MKILIIGGTKYFGKRIVQKFLESGDEVSLLTRGLTQDNFGNSVKRLKADRNNKNEILKAVGKQNWDVVLDQRCMNAKHAQAACDIFHDKTNHYVMTSSVSVYDLGAGIVEEAFVAETYKFTEIADEFKDYKEAKRQAEAVFARDGRTPVSFVRPPIVLGEDDYTGRLEFHIERIKKEKPLYLPNLNAKISFVLSSDAAKNIYDIARKNKAVGAVHIASDEPIALGDLMNLISEVVGKGPVYASDEASGDGSPFGLEADWYLDVKKARSLRLHNQELKQWLPQLISKLAVD